MKSNLTIPAGKGSYTSIHSIWQTCPHQDIHHSACSQELVLGTQQ